MSNPYYTAPDIPVDFTVARSAPIRAQFEAIEAAFDKLTGRTTFLVAGGTANALTVTMDVPPESYEEGLLLFVKITETNTDTATLNVNSLGPVEIVTRVNDPLVAGDLIEGSVETLFYVDGHFMIREVAGAQGPQGPIGPSDGPPGLSAYEVAVEEGYVGTVTQWLLSLVGADGADGADGNTVLHGTAVPGAGDGLNGDFYIQLVADVPTTIYGPKALGAWPPGESLIGPPGADGADGVDGVDGADGTGSSWNDLADKPANLTAIAALVLAAGKMIYGTGAGAVAMTDSTAYGRSLLNMANSAALIADLGVIAVQEFDPSSPGYLRLNCAGVIFSIMWGTTTAAANGTTTITYPDGGFSSFSIPSGSAIGATNVDAQHNQAGVQSATASQFVLFSASDTARPFFWIAVGI